MTSATRDQGLDRLWAVPVALAAAAGSILCGFDPVVLALIAVALVPWVFELVGRRLLVWLFAVLAIAPVVGVLLITGLNAAMFLATTALALLVSRARRRSAVVAAIVVGVVLPFTGLVPGRPFDPGFVYFAIGDLLGIAVGLLVGRTRRLGDELRAADAGLAAAAAQDERTRLARDVHDLVAHSLTVVVLQVGGARRVLRSDPDAAAAALAQAETVCRESLDGIREIVGLLRTGDEGGTEAADLGRLVETYRAAGVEIALALHGDLDELSLVVRGTLHRVIREALANAARYRAPGSPVTVDVRVDADAVVLRIANRRAGRPPASAGGHGLVGLREQVAALGGTLDGAPSGDEWVVSGRLPRRASVRGGAVAV